MTRENAVYRRVLRRETHSSRSAVAIVVASAVALVLVGGVGLAIWAAADASVAGAVRGAVRTMIAPEGSPALPVAVGAVAAVLGLILVLLALLPGRRARRGRTRDRVALLVDDGIAADAVAASVARRNGLDRRNVSVTVRRRTVEIRVVPHSGVPVDAAASDDEARGVFSALGFEIRPRTTVARKGVVA